jgi:hypothetical protein
VSLTIHVQIGPDARHALQQPGEEILDCFGERTRHRQLFVGPNRFTATSSVRVIKMKT